MLSSGGIPGSINGSTLSDCSYAAHTAITSITLMHAWVVANIPGSACPSHICVYDPSFKPHTWKTSIARTATGIAGETSTPFATATGTMGSGTDIPSGLPYVQSLDQGDLYTQLTRLSSNYVTYIKTNNLQGAQIEDIVGGGVIIPDYSSLRQSTMTGYTGSPNFTTPLAGIPDQFRSKLAVKLTQYVNPTTTTFFDFTFFADEIYGRRLRPPRTSTKPMSPRPATIIISP